MGMDAELAAKQAAKYSDQDEALARQYIKQMTGVTVPAGPDAMSNFLKDGSVLCALANAIKPGSAGPGKAEKMAFKQMENIAKYLEACNQIGVLVNESFQTVDLYENRNMGQVVIQINALQRRAAGKGALNSTAHKSVPVDQSVVGLQYGSNKGATQSGMSFGGSRQIGGNDKGGQTGGAATIVNRSPAAAAASGGGGGAKFCPECGAKNDGAKFCAECGAKM